MSSKENRGELRDEITHHKQAQVMWTDETVPKRFSIAEIAEAVDIPDEHRKNVITHGLIAAVLNNLAETGTKMASARAAGISWQHWDKFRRVNKDQMDPLVDAALEMYRERISYAIHSRAIDGWLEPVFYKGEEVGHIRRFSDRLLLAQAKRHMPEYRDDSATKLDVSLSSGVLVVSQPAITAAEWQERAAHITAPKQVENLRE